MLDLVESGLEGQPSLQRMEGCPAISVHVGTPGDCPVQRHPHSGRTTPTPAAHQAHFPWNSASATRTIIGTPRTSVSKRGTTARTSGNVSYICFR